MTTEEIMNLADVYAGHLQAGCFDDADSLRAALLAAVEELVRRSEAAAEMAKDAELGRIAMRFVDRAGDVHPGIDDADRICSEFYNAMDSAINAAMKGQS